MLTSAVPAPLCLLPILPYLTGTLQVSEPAATPEPSTWAMVLGAFAGAAAWMRAHRLYALP